MSSLNTAAQRFFSGLALPGVHPPGERFYIYGLCVFLGLLSADLTILNFRDTMLPSKAPPIRPQRIETGMSIARSEYDTISQRNILNADGVIAPALGSENGVMPENEPVPSNLPIQLVGTLVHLNPNKSVATLNITSINKINSYRVHEDIEGLASVTQIERQKVVFRNSNNHRLEYVEIKKEAGLSLGVSKAQAPASGDNIVVDGDNVTVSKDEVLKQTANLSDVLNQASAVPNFVPGSGGKINGYRLVNIQQGSIYEKLGLRRFDVIKGVNNEPVDSPAKAMELYNQLKTSSALNLQIERNGAEKTLNFTIK